MHRLLAAQDAIYASGRGNVVHLVCQHDPGCSIYTACRQCDCVPEVSAHVDGTGTVLAVDENGRTTKMRAS